MSNVFAPSLTASCRQLSATLHGVVFHILVGSANRLGLAAPVRVANGNPGQQGRFRPGHIGNRTPRAFPQSHHTATMRSQVVACQPYGRSALRVSSTITRLNGYDSTMMGSRRDHEYP